MCHILMILLASERDSLGLYRRTRQIQKVDFGLSSLLRGDCFAVKAPDAKYHEAQTFHGVA
jgi:hypothetical protein